MLAARFISSLIADAVDSVRYRWVLYRLAEKTGAIFEPGVEVRGVSRLTVGAGSIVGAGSLLHCGGQSWSGGGGGVRIGCDSYIGPRSVLFGAGGIEIGDKVAISPGCVLASHGHDIDGDGRPIVDEPAVFRPIVIEDDVYLGSGAVILPGVRVGRGAVVGAGAVVSRDVASRAVVTGVPARVARERAFTRGVEREVAHA